jgi:N-formylglutamate amidohydrolase
MSGNHSFFASSHNEAEPQAMRAEEIFRSYHEAVQEVLGAYHEVFQSVDVS